MEMEFRILGSFEVVGSAGALELPGAKRRGLLACLVTHAGQPMSTDRLVEELRVTVALPVRTAPYRPTCPSCVSCCTAGRRDW
jgi:hypothetical protein